MERKDKSEKPPALYDLTTLQRDANRLLGFTAQQTLDYLQNLYEKKLCTYPRTDSRYLTSDMAASLPELVRLTAGALPFAAGMELACNAAQVINDKKVTDHHAVIPTRNLRGADLTGLPVGEKAVLELVALRLLCAVAQPYTFAETAVVVECAGAEFTAKGRTVKQPGWRALDAAYRAGLKNAEPETEDKALPELSERSDTAPFWCCRQGGQDHPAQALHRRYAAFRDGDCREGRYAGGRRTQGPGDPGHPRRYLGKAGVHRLSGTQKEQENRAAHALP